MELIDLDNPQGIWHPLCHNLSGRQTSRDSTTIFRFPPDEVLKHEGDLGDFSRHLPLEIVQMILEQLNFTALAALVHTSKGMRCVVRSLPKLRGLLAHVPDVMRAIATSGTGHIITCAGLYQKLINPSCDECESPGSHLHLLACARLCSECLVSNTRYRPLHPTQAADLYALPMVKVARLPALHLPRRPLGREALTARWRRVHSSADGLIDEREVHRLAARTYGSVEEAREQAAAELTSFLLAERCRSIFGGVGHYADLQLYRDTWPPTPQIPLPSEWYQLPDRYAAEAASVWFPWLDLNTRTLGRPVICQACHDAGAPPRKRYYCAAAADEHMERLGEIVKGAHKKNRYNEKN